jgi:hypothetical protein
MMERLPELSQPEELFELVVSLSFMMRSPVDMHYFIIQDGRVLFQGWVADDNIKPTRCLRPGDMTPLLIPECNCCSLRW